MTFPLSPIHPRGKGYYQPHVRGHVGNTEGRFERSLGRHLSLRVLPLSDYDSLDVAIVQINGYGTLVIDKNMTLDATTYTIPVGVCVVGMGGIITLASGTTLTINGCVKGDIQIFDNSAGGTMSIVGQEINPSWFGDDSAALTAAVAALGDELALTIGDTRTIITPEHFGCDRTGETVCTTELQAFFDFFLTRENTRRYVGRGYGCYRIDDTITLGDTADLEYHDIKVGRPYLNRVESWSDSDNLPSGILYAGGAGNGIDPEDCKPAVRIKQCKNGHLSLTVFQDKTGTPAQNTTGILFSSNDAKQYGAMVIDFMEVAHFARGYVIGLSDHDGGLINNSGGYNDDVFEANTINLMRSLGCRFPLFMSCKTSDSTVINKMTLSAYRPGVGNDADFGGGYYRGIELENGGSFTVQSLWMASSWVGQRYVLVPNADIDEVTDTMTYAGHGFSNDERCHVIISNPQPDGLERDILFYFVNCTADTFQIALTSGGAAVDIGVLIPDQDGMFYELTGDEWNIFTHGVRVNILDSHYENKFAGVLHAEGTKNWGGRGTHNLKNVRSSPLTYTVENKAVESTGPLLSLFNCGLAGEVYFIDRIFAAHCFFMNNDVTTGRFVNTGSARPEPTLLDISYQATVSGSVLSDQATHLLSRPLIYGEGVEQYWPPGKWTIHSELAAFDSATDVDTTNNKITVSNTFLDDDPIILTTAGTLPGGLALQTRYFVANRAAGEFQLADRDGNIIDITTTGSGTHTAYHGTDVCQYQIDPTASAGLRFKIDGFCKRTGDDGVMAFDADAVFLRETAGPTEWRNFSASVLGAGSISGFDMVGGITYDSTLEVVTVTLVSISSAGQSMSGVLTAKVYGFSANSQLWPSNTLIGTTEDQEFTFVNYL